MPDSESPAETVEIRFTPEFKRNLRALAKKYRHIRASIEPVLQLLEQGETPGDQVPNIGYTIYKVRIKNPDAKRGKRDTG
jgi:mRNA-degrading endonuclease RelE of RelBE toxin-antitoxin system